MFSLLILALVDLQDERDLMEDPDLPVLSLIASQPDQPACRWQWHGWNNHVAWLEMQAEKRKYPVAWTNAWRLEAEFWRDCWDKLDNARQLAHPGTRIQRRQDLALLIGLWERRYGIGSFNERVRLNSLPPPRELNYQWDGR